jgi:predicted acetyltransferase
VPILIDPTPALRESFLAAVDEFHADQDYPTPWFVTDVDPAARESAEAFESYVRRVLDERREEHARATGWVPMTTLWWAEDGVFLARLAIRHRLTPALAQVGGHIGYDVRPSARRRGHATALLAAALPVARALGIEEALLTCDETNTGSRRVIEANGGRFDGGDGVKRRYWVPTAPSGASGLSGPAARGYEG